MKKLLSFILVLTMLMSVTVLAFADSPNINPEDGGYGVNSDEIDLDSIPETEASTDKEKVECVEFTKLTPENQAIVRTLAMNLINSGYKIVSGFAVRVIGDENGVIEDVIVRIKVPKDYDVFVDGVQVIPTEENGEFFIDVTTPAFVFIVHK